MIDCPPVSDRDSAVYVHFPYCARRCEYCDFNAHAIEHSDQAYADAVLAELDAHARALHAPAGLRTVFFGGGTPSRWDPTQVGRVINGLRETFGFADDIEITLEANPGTVAQARFEGFVAAGINRFSIGVQSLDDGELSALGRIHDAASAVRAVTTARATGARVSLDLMYGFPNQCWDSVRRTLDGALALGTEHVSAYALTVEPTTVLGRKASLGRFIPMPDDDQAELMNRVLDHLETAGLRRYEVSNFSRPGAESKHNCLYWAGGAYLGLGAGAHSYLPTADLQAAIRRENRRSPDGYVRGTVDRTFPTTFVEHIEGRQLLIDRLLTVMRTRWGLNLAALDERFRARGTIQAALQPALDALVADGWVVLDEGWYKPTGLGFMLNDAVVRRLCAPLDSTTAPPQLQEVG